MARVATVGNVDKVWRFRVHSWVRADPRLVFEWFVDAERWADRGRFFAGLDSADFHWADRTEAGVQGVVAAWVSVSGIAIDLRITAWAEPERLLQHLNISQVRVHPDGREDRTEQRSVLEFRPDPSYGTRVVMVGEVTKQGHRFWEVSAMARYREQRHRSWHLRESVRKCGLAIESGGQESVARVDG